MTTASPSRRGATALEFALLLPLWFAIVIAIVDFGWLFYQDSLLDTAANLGCRAGSLLDPGEGDERIAWVEGAANDRMVQVLVDLGRDEDCETCQVDAFTAGEPPRRSLVCVASREMQPLVGLYYDTLVLSSVQVARLEWQHAAAVP